MRVNCLAQTFFDEEGAPEYGYYSVNYGSILDDVHVVVSEPIIIQFRPPNKEIGGAEVQVQGGESKSSTVSDGTNSYDVNQAVFVGYEIVQDIDTPNQLGFMFELDISKKLIPDRSVIFQYAQYKKDDGDFFSTAEKVGVACVTQVGNKDTTQIINFRGDFAMNGDLADGTADYWFDQHAANRVDVDPRDGTEFFRKREDDPEVYEIDGFGSSNPSNAVARCLAQLEFPKEDFNLDWFGNYTVTYGARIYRPTPRPRTSKFPSKNS